MRTCIAPGSSVRKRQMSAAFSAARARDRFILKKCRINVRNIRSYLENRKWFSKFFNSFLSTRRKPTHTPYCARVCTGWFLRSFCADSSLFFFKNNAKTQKPVRGHWWRWRFYGFVLLIHTRARAHTHTDLWAGWKWYMNKNNGRKCSRSSELT